MARKIPVAVALFVLFLGATNAAQLETSPIEPGRVMTRDLPVPLAPFSITHNLDPNTLVSGTSVACVGAATRDTGWWRVFDLDADHGLTGEACVQSVDYGIETAVGTQSIELFVGCLPDSAPQPGSGGTIDLDFVNQVGSHSQPQPEATLEFFSIDASGCCDAESESLVIGLLSEDCEETDCGGGPGSCCLQLFIGANDLGMTETSYISAPDCGIDDPVDGAAICFECNRVVMVVNGTDDSPGGDVPASTGLGAVLTMLLLLAGSAWLLRGRVRN